MNLYNHATMSRGPTESSGELACEGKCVDIVRDKWGQYCFYRLRAKDRVHAQFTVGVYKKDGSVWSSAQAIKLGHWVRFRNIVRHPNGTGFKTRSVSTIEVSPDVCRTTVDECISLSELPAVTRENEHSVYPMVLRCTRAVSCDRSNKQFGYFEDGSLCPGSGSDGSREIDVAFWDVRTRIHDGDVVKVELKLTFFNGKHGGKVNAEPVLATPAEVAWFEDRFIRLECGETVARHTADPVHMEPVAKRTRIEDVPLKVEQWTQGDDRYSQLTPDCSSQLKSPDWSSPLIAPDALAYVSEDEANEGRGEVNETVPSSEISTGLPPNLPSQPSRSQQKLEQNKLVHDDSERTSPVAADSSDPSVSRVQRMMQLSAAISDYCCHNIHNVLEKSRGFSDETRASMVNDWVSGSRDEVFELFSTECPELFDPSLESLKELSRRQHAASQALEAASNALEAASRALEIAKKSTQAALAMHT